MKPDHNQGNHNGKSEEHPHSCERFVEFGGIGGGASRGGGEGREANLSLQICDGGAKT